jgi:hypothetical protein
MNKILKILRILTQLTIYIKGKVPHSALGFNYMLMLILLLSQLIKSVVDHITHKSDENPSRE